MDEKPSWQDTLKEFSNSGALYRRLIDEIKADPESFREFVELFASQVPEIKLKRYVTQNEKSIYQSTDEIYKALGI